MKNSRSFIDRFCATHPDFGIPNLMKYLTIANVVFWLVGSVNPVFLSYMTFSPRAILQGQVWRLVSFIFYPPSSGILAIIAFYFYYMIGTTLEQHWGTARFNLYFFSGVILTMVYGFLIYFVAGVSFNVSTEFIYLSMFFSFAALYPDMQVLLFFILPLKIKWLAIVDAGLFLYQVFVMPFPYDLLPVVAVINCLIFCWGDLQTLLPRKQSETTINFRKASARIRREQQANLYQHTCAVCGRTDKDYPNLQFRYCSRCAGYHCFCEDHINSHIHFTE